MNTLNNPSKHFQKKPDWLRMKLPKAGEYAYLKEYLSKFQLHTICESGNCPNIGECWENKTATFMILGDICTRSCGFCAVKTGKPLAPDFKEPERIAEVIRQMNLKHCVITSVDRDDLADGGADIWAMTINAIKKLNPEMTLEALIPDFKGNQRQLITVIQAKPDILSHNLETVERLTKKVRVQAKYERSLEVLKFISSQDIIAKSGIMLGLGETKDEVLQTMEDLLNVGCKILTLGQYLQPSKKHLAVERYVHPDEFEELRKLAIQKGFTFAECGPLVRSSYHAERHLPAKNIEQQKNEN
jgi:lipoic acid synthetase